MTVTGVETRHRATPSLTIGLRATRLERMIAGYRCQMNTTRMKRAMAPFGVIRVTILADPGLAFPGAATTNHVGIRKRREHMNGCKCEQE
ncbi:hypothetical protein C6503_17170 [Candidatus Poribacteria bacterium]|nr:MAG: hypothetical protein C6503_17170 [Candidatus Poribacteria bacterium]